MNFIPFGEIPQELADAIRQREELHHMSHQDFTHRVMALLEEQSEDNLHVLTIMLKHVTNDDNFMHGYYHTMIATELFKRFGICYCGDKHTEPEDFLKKEPVSGDAIPNQRDNRSEEVLEDLTTAKPSNCRCSDEQFQLNGCLCGMDMWNYNKKFHEYGLKQGDNGLLCNNCKTPYVSLADRALRAPGPEGCEGCIHKEKWG